MCVSLNLEALSFSSEEFNIPEFSEIVKKRCILLGVSRFLKISLDIG